MDGILSFLSGRPIFRGKPLVPGRYIVSFRVYKDTTPSQVASYDVWHRNSPLLRSSVDSNHRRRRTKPWPPSPGDSPRFGGKGMEPPGEMSFEMEPSGGKGWNLQGFPVLVGDGISFLVEGYFQGHFS